MASHAAGELVFFDLEVERDAGLVQAVGPVAACARVQPCAWTRRARDPLEGRASAYTSGCSRWIGRHENPPTVDGLGILGRGCGTAT